MDLEDYWQSIPIGKLNAVTYRELCISWDKSERAVRKILHDLNIYDNGDDLILIRSSTGKGFYRTDDVEIIKAFKRECISRGQNVLAPIKKMNRVLKASDAQFNIENNLRLLRVKSDLKQSTVCDLMKRLHPAFDNSLLSKMENGLCLPTPTQLAELAKIYGCQPDELVRRNDDAEI